MPEHNILDEWFAKIDSDIGFFAECFAEVLEELGEGELANALPWRTGKPQMPLSKPRVASGMDPELRVLSIAYHLLNLVEENAAAQARREREIRFGLLHEPGLWGHSLSRLVKQGFSESEIVAGLKNIHVEVVLTAHPTEAKRPPVLRQHRELFSEFTQLEFTVWTPHERENIRRQIKVMLERLWRTGEMYLTKPEVLSELDHVLDYFRVILPPAVSLLRQRLGDAWEESGLSADSLRHAAPSPRITFGDWVGGDRDGHPLVTAEVTAETFMRLRRAAVEVLKAHLDNLSERLSLSDLFQVPPAKFLDALEIVTHNRTQAYPHEPWREYVHALCERLNGSETGESGSYLYAVELAHDLQVLRQSLVDVGAQRLAHAEVDPLLTHLESFGFHMAALDIRQNSAFYAKAVAQLLKAAGFDDWNFAAWDMKKRWDFLQGELRTLRPLGPRHGLAGEESNAVLQCFQTVADHISQFGTEGVGSFIVSMTTDVSDLLVPYLFAREVGLLRSDNGDLRSEIEIVPLFETLDDLDRSAGILREFLRHPITRRSRTTSDGAPCAQQVMVGYSDSNKDAGIFASNWALHRAQAVLAEVGRELGVRITFFHGRGGTFSRGAGPTHRFLESLPSGSLSGHVRTTEQGEVIAQKFGNLSTAVFNLELLMAGVTVTALKHSRAKAENPRFVALCDRISAYSSAAYRDLVNSDGFLDFWSMATPIDALECSFIGSRPARRTGKRNLEDLRAIPWVFSWTQARYYLSGWYGLGTGLEKLKKTDPDGFRMLRESANELPFVRYVLYNSETSLASADLGLMRNYAALVPDEGVRERQYSRIADEYHRTEDMIDQFFGESRAKRRPRLQKTLEMRATGLRRLHERQIQLLSEWRSLRAKGQEQEADALFPSLLLSINAIASAQRTTG